MALDLFKIDLEIALQKLGHQRLEADGDSPPVTARDTEGSHEPDGCDGRHRSVSSLPSQSVASVDIHGDWKPAALADPFLLSQLDFEPRSGADLYGSALYPETCTPRSDGFTGSAADSYARQSTSSSPRLASGRRECAEQGREPCTGQDCGVPFNTPASSSSSSTALSRDSSMTSVGGPGADKRRGGALSAALRPCRGGIGYSSSEERLRATHRPLSRSVQAVDCPAGVCPAAAGEGALAASEGQTGSPHDVRHAPGETCHRKPESEQGLWAWLALPRLHSIEEAG